MSQDDKYCLIICLLTWIILLLGSKRDPEDRIVPRSVDADDSDVDIKSDDDRYLLLSSSLRFFVSCSLSLAKNQGWGW